MDCGPGSDETIEPNTSRIEDLANDRRGGVRAKPPAHPPYLFSRPPSTGRVAHRAGSAGLLSAYSNNGKAYSKTGRAKSILTIFRTANEMILGSTTTNEVERMLGSAPTINPRHVKYRSLQTVGGSVSLSS